MYQSNQVGPLYSSNVSDGSTDEHAPSDIVSYSSEHPASQDDVGAVASSSPNDETPPHQVEAHPDGANSSVQVRTRTVAVLHEVRTLHVDHGEVVSDMPPMTLPPVTMHHEDDIGAVVVKPGHQVVL